MCKKTLKNLHKIRLLTMLLAASDILRPIAGMGVLVVKESSDAKLFSGGSVPARPVASARGFVTEDSVKPVAMFRADRRI